MALVLFDHEVLHRALKKEIEQIEKGELDSKLVTMWEEIQK